ncbi:MAG: phosphate ABC transporter substrate-binding protein PstS, partial [Solirubrobacterales bacterium]|nr:phosphate ABC transporter substrate-binding protein PstS [Solirubrobacterales bacterium]
KLEEILNLKKWFVAVPLTLALAFGVAACGSSDSDSGGSSGDTVSGEIAGAGSSAQEAAMNGWIAAFQDANPDATLSYDPVGSGGGREQFIAGGTSFGGTDSPMDETELADVAKRCDPGDYIEIPVYISPIAMAYNIDGVDDLNLSADTAAQIFAGDITKWNDPAIAADNPNADLPDQDIVVVHRSDESGTTENFTDYLHQNSPKYWPDEGDGVWPLKGGEAANGTSGVVSAIKSGSGTIGYADLSQVGDLNVANVKVGDSYVAPSAEAAAKIFEESKRIQGEGKYVFAYDLDRTAAAQGLYPISLVSYEMACTTYDKADEAKLVKAFYTYIISEEGQQDAATTAGSAPIPDSLRKEITPAVEAIQTS